MSELQELFDILEQQTRFDSGMDFLRKNYEETHWKH